MSSAVSGQSDDSSSLRMPSGEQLWQSWNDDTPVSLDSLSDRLDALPVDQLVAAVRHDQCSRWQSGDFVPLEDYVQRFPLLAADQDQLLDLIYSEFLLCEEFDRLPDTATFLQRFPNLAASLRRQFQLHEVIRSVPDNADEKPEEQRGGAQSDRESEADVRTIGGYQIVELLGQGGMGSVYRAVHPRLKREVALKVLLDERTQDHGAIERFQREIEAVGTLDHPNIVRATDAGEDGGTHFLVMELVEGHGLATLVKRFGPLPIDVACEVIRQAAVGLEHAHRNGLIHRDVKPSNLLISSSGQVKVLDFGMSLLQHRLPGRQLTSENQLLGTLDYIAPEQASDTHSVDERADIYSLGCTLFHLLTGAPPFGGPEYPSPLKKMMAHARSKIPAIRSRREDVPQDLAPVIERMLAKSPVDRPGTVQEVVELLQPFVAGVDLEQWIPSNTFANTSPESDRTDAISRLSNFADRNEARTAVMPDSRSTATATMSGRSTTPFSPFRRAGVLAAAGILAVVGLLTWDGFRERPAPDRSRDDNRQAVAADSGHAPESVVDQQPESPDGTLDQLRREDIPLRELTAAGGGDPSRAPAELVAVLGRSRLHHGSSVNRIAYFDSGELLISSGSAGLVQVGDPLTGEVRWSVQTGLSQPQIGVSRQHSRVVGSGPNLIRTYDLTSGDLIAEQPIGFSRPYTDLTIDVERDQVALVRPDRSVEIHRTSDNRQIDGFSGLDAQDPVALLRFSPDGARIAIGTHGGRVVVWDRGRREFVLDSTEFSGQALSLEFSPDGSLLAAGGADESRMHTKLVVTEVDSGTKTIVDPSGGWHDFEHLAFHPNGQRLAVNRVQRVDTYDTFTGEVDGSFGIDAHRAVALAWHPSGRQLAAATTTGNIRVIDTASGRLVESSIAHRGPVSDVVFTPDGRQVLSAGVEDSALLSWDLSSGQSENPLSDGRRIVGSLSMDPTGRWLAATYRWDRVMLFDTSDWSEAKKLAAQIQKATAIAFSPRDSTVALASVDGTMAIHDISTGAVRHTMGHGGPATAVDFSPDGLLLASAGGTTVKFWDVDSGNELAARDEHRTEVTALAFSPNGNKLATGSQTTIRIWNVETRNMTRVLRRSGKDRWPVSLAFHPGGRILAESDGAVINFRNTETGELRHSIDLAPIQDVWTLSFSPGGGYLAAGNENGTIYLLRINVDSVSN